MHTDSSDKDRENKSLLKSLYLHCVKGRPKTVISVVTTIILGFFIMINNEGEGVLLGIVWIAGTVPLILFLSWLFPFLFK